MSPPSPPAALPTEEPNLLERVGKAIGGFLTMRTTPREKEPTEAIRRGLQSLAPARAETTPEEPELSPAAAMRLRKLPEGQAALKRFSAEVRAPRGKVPEPVTRNEFIQSIGRLPVGGSAVTPKRTLAEMVGGTAVGLPMGAAPAIQEISEPVAAAMTAPLWLGQPAGSDAFLEQYRQWNAPLAKQIAGGLLEGVMWSALPTKLGGQGATRLLTKAGRVGLKRLAPMAEAPPSIRYKPTAAATATDAALRGRLVAEQEAEAITRRSLADLEAAYREANLSPEIKQALAEQEAYGAGKLAPPEAPVVEPPLTAPAPARQPPVPPVRTGVAAPVTPEDVSVRPVVAKAATTPKSIPSSALPFGEGPAKAAPKRAKITVEVPRRGGPGTESKAVVTGAVAGDKVVALQPDPFATSEKLYAIYNKDGTLVKSGFESASKAEAAAKAKGPLPEAVPPTPPAVPPAAKEPWRMTQAEAVKYPKSGGMEHADLVYLKRKNAHARAVFDAHAEGKPVPAEVLAEYGLTAKAKPAVPAGEAKRQYPSEVIAVEREGGLSTPSYKYRIGRVTTDIGPRYEIQMSRFSEDKWEGAQMGRFVSQDTAKRAFSVRFRTLDISKIEGVDPVVQAGIDQRIAKEAAERTQREVADAASELQQKTETALRAQVLDDFQKAKFKTQPVKISLQSKEKGNYFAEESGPSYGGLVVTKTGPKTWNITHQASGLSVGRSREYESQAAAKLAAYRMSKFVDFTQDAQAVPKAIKALGEDKAHYLKRIMEEPYDTWNPSLEMTTAGPTPTAKVALPERPVVPPGTGTTPLKGPGPGATAVFHLPEPPRELPEFMASKRREMAGVFKKKGGEGAVMDTVEQARQMVLKSRDMGTNTVPLVMSEIRNAGDITTAFGLDKLGVATRVGNPEGRSLAINDVLSNWTHYDLTPAQKEIARRQGFIYREARRLAESYGVEINELGGPDEFWQYIARRVKGKLNPVTGKYEMPGTGVGGFKMGAKISAQKERQFEQMAEGVDLGYLYEHPNEVLAHHIRGIYRLIGNKQAEQIVEGLTREVTKEAPQVFGESFIFEPALRGRVAPTEVARAIDKIFSPDQQFKAVRMASDVSGALVGQTAAADISAPFLQNLPVLGHDIKQAVMGKPSFIWAQSYGKMLQALKNPQTINAFREANTALYKSATEYGILTGQSEFVSGVGTVQRGLRKIPVVGKTLSEGYRQVYGRAGQAYSDALEVARIKMFEQMAPVWQKEGENLFDLGQLVNRMTGAVSAEARGVSATLRQVERILLFAPNYMRSSLLVLKDLVSTGKAAREVQTSLAALAGVGAAVYYIEEKMRGNEPKMKPWPKRFGGDGADAFTTLVGSTRVGLGSWMYGMTKMAAEVGAQAIDDPSALIVWNEDHPIVRFLKTKQGPMVGLARELAMGENFYGKEFETSNDYLMRIVQAIIPISAQTFTETPKGGKEQVITSLLGLRSYPAHPMGVAFKNDRQINPQGLEWEKAEPWQVKAMLQKYPDISEQLLLRGASKYTKARQQWAKLDNQYYTQEQELSNEMASGTISGPQFRQLYQKMQGEKAAAKAATNRALGVYQEDQPLPEDPNDRALAEYYKIQESAVLPSSRFDFDKAEAATAALKARWTPAQAAYVERNTGLTFHPPFVQQYLKEMDSLRPYWQIADQVWARYSPDVKAASDKWNMKRDMEGAASAGSFLQRQLPYQVAQQVRLANAQITLARNTWKDQHPVEAQLLRKWY